MQIAFEPTPGTTQTLTTSTTSSRALIGGQPTQATVRQQLYIANEGTVTAFYRVGDSTVVATAADVPVLPNTFVVHSINVPFGVTGGAYIAAINATGTGKLYVTTGVGVR